MSLADTASTALARPGSYRAGAFARQIRSEVRLVFGRRRNQILLGLLGAIPLLIGIAVKASNHGGADAGPQFLNRVTDNGLFLVLATLLITLNLALPVAVGIMAADAVAGEAQTGTLRYLLTVPVRRGRLLAVKAAGIAAYSATAIAVIAVVAAIAGAALFGAGSFTLLGGQTVSLGEAILRISGVALYVWLSLAGLLAVGLFFSTLTEVPIAAMATTIGFAIISLVLDSIPQLSSIHPLLVSHYWRSFGTLLRVNPNLGSLASHLLLQLAYVAIAGTLTWARFGNADITA
jgi:ABC-2 type transport system permease protein